MVRKSTWTFFIVLAGVALLFGGGLNQVYADTTEEFSVENETVDVNYTSPVAVDAAGEAQAFNDSSVVVRNATGYELDSGIDYEWYENGSVGWFNTSETSESEHGLVTYGYHDQTESTEFGGTAMQLTGSLAVLGLLLVAGKFVLGSIWGW